jgi:hypothetical protein
MFIATHILDLPRLQDALPVDVTTPNSTERLHATPMAHELG